MKISEVVVEGILGSIGRGIATMAGVKVPPEMYPAPKTKPPTAHRTEPHLPQLTAAASAPSTALPHNVEVVTTNPIVLRVNKQMYEIDDDDQWHPLGSKKTLSPGQAAILNKYLGMI